MPTFEVRLKTVSPIQVEAASVSVDPLGVLELRGPGAGLASGAIVFTASPGEWIFCRRVDQELTPAGGTDDT